MKIPQTNSNLNDGQNSKLNTSSDNSYIKESEGNLRHSILSLDQLEEITYRDLKE